MYELATVGDLHIPQSQPTKNKRERDEGDIYLPVKTTTKPQTKSHKDVIGSGHIRSIMGSRTEIETGKRETFVHQQSPGSGMSSMPQYSQAAMQSQSQYQHSNPPRQRQPPPPPPPHNHPHQPVPPPPRQMYPLPRTDHDDISPYAQRQYVDKIWQQGDSLSSPGINLNHWYGPEAPGQPAFATVDHGQPYASYNMDPQYLPPTSGLLPAGINTRVGEHPLAPPPLHVDRSYYRQADIQLQGPSMGIFGIDAHDMIQRQPDHQPPQLQGMSDTYTMWSDAPAGSELRSFFFRFVT